MAVYHVDVDDMQFFEFVVGGFGLLRVVSNIDEVDIDGVELSLNFAATDWLSLYAGANFNDTEIKKNEARPDSVGNESPYTPGLHLERRRPGAVPDVGRLRLRRQRGHLRRRRDLVPRDPEQRPPDDLLALIPRWMPANYSVAQRDAYSLVNLRAGIVGRPLVAGGLRQERPRRGLPARK